MLLGVALVLMFSRLVIAEEFGQYAKGYAYINVMGALLYGWLQISLLRLAEGKENCCGPRLGTIIAAMVMPIAPCLLLAYIFYWFGLIAYPIAVTSATVAYGASVCFSQYARGINNAKLYALLGITRFLGVFGAAYILTRHSPNAASLLYALAVGGVAAVFIGVVFIAYVGKKNVLAKSETSIFETKALNMYDLFRYGAPAAVSLVIVMLVIHGDRFVVGLFMSNVEVAHYSAQADLARQMIYPIISALSVSLVPEALKRNRDDGFEAARKYIDRESSTTLNLILPILMVVIVFGKEIMTIILPAGYVNDMGPIAALVAVSAFLTGCRMVRFDPVFHLELRASKIGFSALIGLLVWVGFIFPFTYYYGAIGAACAGILGATSSLFYSYYVATNKAPSMFLFPKSSFSLLFLLLGTPIFSHEVIFKSLGVAAVELFIVLFALYAILFAFLRWTKVRE